MMKRITAFKLLIGLLMASLVFTGQAFFVSAEDGTDDNLYIIGNADYSKASDVVSRVNAERKKNGLSSLSRDSDLENAALVRAAECVLYFEHARPNGMKWDSVHSKVYGENLAMGTSSASKVMSLWMASPGHKANILRSSFKSIGVACFEYGGTYYWVQLFGTSGGSGSSGGPSGATSVALDLPSPGSGASFELDYKINYYITGGASSGIYGETAGSKARLASDDTAAGSDVKGDDSAETSLFYSENVLRMFVGSTASLGLTGDYLSFDPSRVNWISSDDAVAAIDDGGSLSILAPGKVKISANSGSIERELMYIDARKDIREIYIIDNFAGTTEIGERTYLGAPVRPVLTVVGRDGILKEGEDYSIRYTDNDKAGEAHAEIRGIGDYGGTVKLAYNIKEGVDPAEGDESAASTEAVDAEEAAGDGE